jgi:hypothetical protein
MESSSELSSSTQHKKAPHEHTNHLGSSSLDSSILRFPTPATDERVSIWVEKTAAASMSAHSEDGSTLGDSSYDFVEEVDTDREDNATESIASTDFGRPDDVASLADTVASGSESGDEEQSEQAASQRFPDFEQAVQQAFDTPTLGRSSTVMIEDEDRQLSRSIEFEEPLSLGAGNVSVKHTVTEFSEEETARLTQNGEYQGSPKRLVVTIRQTMTKQCLSTKEPLRILYVGSHSAKQDIIHKIASTVTASAGSDKRSRQSGQWTYQLYNVVPVSAFGSERAPEIELMHSSGYQIRVEDCLYVQRLEKEASPKQPDILRLTTEEGSYHSVPDRDGYVVEHQGDMPHIAVIYHSETDDDKAVETRQNAAEFMARHRIPTILISHKHLFARGEFIEIDQHSIHMCLESRDVNGRMNIIHQRLPIDLASFLNIDARQMNRNLAFITGLIDYTEDSGETRTDVYKKDDIFTKSSDEEIELSLSNSIRFIRNQFVADWRAIVPIGLLVMSVLTAILTGIPSYRFSGQPSISINSKLVSDIPSMCTSTMTSSALSSSFTPPSSVAISTSTRTITLTHAQPTGPNSLSVVPSMEIGKSATKFNTAPKANKSVCSAELLSDREVLIRIPSATKLSWLTKEAISVNISREKDIIDTERVYSSDEGIVLSLPKKDAFGILKIAIITTKKPRVNETFEIDFGTSAYQTCQAVMQKMSSMFSDNLSFSGIRAAADRAVTNVQTQTQATIHQVEEARKIAEEQTKAATGSLTELAHSVSMEAAKRGAIISKEIGIRIAGVEAKLSETAKDLAKIQEPVSEGVLKAQVQSKLLWLKMQGKKQEYQQYEKAAVEAIRAKSLAKKEKRNFRDSVDHKAAAAQLKLDRKAKRAAKKEARAAKKYGKGTR